MALKRDPISGQNICFFYIRALEKKIFCDFKALNYIISRVL